MPVTTKYPHGSFGCPGYCSGDAKAAIDFYSGLFGWEAKPMQMPEGSYTLFKLKGENVAGMYQMADDRKAAGVKPHWNNYLAVDDARATAAKVVSLGGKVLGEPFDMDGEVMANLEDPTGVKLSVWQFKQNPEPTVLNEPGALCWTELITSDSAASAAFYSKLIGWQLKPFEGGPMPYTILELPDQEHGIGGMLQISEEMKDMQPQWMPYFQVDEADRIAARARELGGQVHGPWDMPRVGKIAMINDSEGGLFAIIQPEPCG